MNNQQKQLKEKPLITTTTKSGLIIQLFIAIIAFILTLGVFGYLGIYGMIVAVERGFAWQIENILVFIASFILFIIYLLIMILTILSLTTHSKAMIMSSGILGITFLAIPFIFFGGLVASIMIFFGMKD